MALGLSGSFGARAAQEELVAMNKRRIDEEQRAIENKALELDRALRERQVVQSELSGDVNRQSTIAGDSLNLRRFTDIALPSEQRDATEFNLKLPVLQNLTPIQKTMAFTGLKFGDVATPEQMTERATAEGQAEGIGKRATFNFGGKDVLQGTEDIQTGGRIKEIQEQGRQSANVARINAGRGIGGGVSFLPTGGGGQKHPALTPEQEQTVKQLQGARQVLMQGARSDRRAAELSNAIESRIQSGDVEGARDIVRDFGIKQLSVSEKQQFDTFSAAEEAASYAHGILTSYPQAAGPWKSLAESAKPWVFIKQDPMYGEARQVVELGQAELRRGLFGTALTAAEKASAGRFLIDDNDPYETMLWKLKGNQEFLKFRQDLTVARSAGLPRPKIEDYLTIGKPPDSQRVVVPKLGGRR